MIKQLDIIFKNLENIFRCALMVILECIMYKCCFIPEKIVSETLELGGKPSFRLIYHVVRVTFPEI